MLGSTLLRTDHDEDFSGDLHSADAVFDGKLQAYGTMRFVRLVPSTMLAHASKLLDLR